MNAPVVVRAHFFVLSFALGACERGSPPGAERRPTSHRIAAATSAGVEVRGPVAPVTSAVSPDQLGTIEDNLPFAPDGTKLASTAWRTWIYTDTGPKRTRYGYLRVGSVVDARGPAIENSGCEGGWYRINPRGFVCIGMGATLDLQHPSVVASPVRPVRRQSLPYLYAIAGEVAPLLYFRLASREQMLAAEGEVIFGRAHNFRERLRVNDALAKVLGPLGPPPPFVSEKSKLEKPYGTKRGLHFSAHAGRAAPETGFSIAQVFEWQDRVFGMTTELELIGLERTKPVVPSEFHGLELVEGQGLPVAFVRARYAQKYRANEQGKIVGAGSFVHREALALTGRSNDSGMLEARDGVWAARSVLRVIEPRTTFPSMATGDRKWIDISINDQTLVAYSGRRAVYATLVSTGRGGLGDPEKDQATVRGTFMIYQKEVSSTMDGEDDKAADSYALRDVPFVQYFHKGFALHGTYWHDEFGRLRSHGCVNLAPIDAAWLFEWTDPVVPPDWHGAINKERGTVVYVHP
jgi:hypothetical protein